MNHLCYCNFVVCQDDKVIFKMYYYPNLSSRNLIKLDNNVFCKAYLIVVILQQFIATATPQQHSYCHQEFINYKYYTTKHNVRFTLEIPRVNASIARRPGPSTVRPSSLGPQEAL